MQDDLYIGYCEYEPKNHTRIICEARCKSGAWIKQDLSSELPPAGKVFAISLPFAREGQYIALTAEPNPRPVDLDKDKLIVRNHWSPREVFDMRGVDQEAIRHKLLVEGFDAPALGTAEVIVALNEAECIVVPLRPGLMDFHFFADPGQLKVHSFDNRVLAGSVIGKRFREVPEVTVGPVLREIGFQDDQTILNSILKRLKIDTGDGPSRNEREKIILYLNRAKAFQASSKESGEVLDWTISFIDRILDHLETVPLIVDVLKEVPEIRAGLEASFEDEKSRIRDEMRARTKAEIAAEMQSLVAGNEKLADEIKAAEQVRDDVMASALALKTQSDILHTQLIQEIEALGQTLEYLTDTENADMDALVRRLRSALGNFGDQLNIGDASIPPWIAPRPQKSIFLDSGQMERAMRREAIRTGIDSIDFEYLDLGLRSGAPLLLAQEAAERMIPAYAKIVSGGVFYREIVGPGTISLDDLWSRPANGTRGGLRQAWTAARKYADHYHIFWLDRIDTAPLQLWLPSLLGILTGDDRPANLLVCMSLMDKHPDPEFAIPEICRGVLGLNPKLGAGSATSIFRKLRGEADVYTVLPISKVEIMEEEDLRDRLEAMGLASPQELALEVGLHHAACLFQEPSFGPSVRLSRLSGLRATGKKWVKRMMRCEETDSD